MKDKLNIEKLFKDKFENFEGDVKPDLWANISQGMASNAAVSSSVGLGVKALIIGVSAVAVGVSAYFIGGFNTTEKNNVASNVSVVEPSDVQTKTDEATVKPETIIIAEANDPVISKNETEILKELIKTEVVTPVEVEVDPEKEVKVQDKNNSSTSKTDGAIDEVEANQETEDNAKDNSNDVVVNTIENSNKDGVEKTNDKLAPSGHIDLFEGESIFEFEFSSNPQNFSKVFWDFGDGTVSYEENPTHVFSEVGSYLVELTIESISGEVHTERERIEIESICSINDIANVITPNGDGINDGFIVNAVNIEEFSITIINQAGKTIFKSNDQNFIWDGTDFSGNNVEKTVFSYYIIAKGSDGVVLKIPGQLYVR